MLRQSLLIFEDQIQPGIVKFEDTEYYCNKLSCKKLAADSPATNNVAPQHRDNNVSCIKPARVRISLSGWELAEANMRGNTQTRKEHQRLDSQIFHIFSELTLKLHQQSVFIWQVSKISYPKYISESLLPTP